MLILANPPFDGICSIKGSTTPLRWPELSKTRSWMFYRRHHILTAWLLAPKGSLSTLCLCLAQVSAGCTRSASDPLLVKLPKSRLTAHLHSFVPLFSHLWNQLPQSVTSSPTNSQALPFSRLLWFFPHSPSPFFVVSWFISFSVSSWLSPSCSCCVLHSTYQTEDQEGTQRSKEQIWSHHEEPG